jgi:Holliday junction DNA helicase RuvA
LIASIQGQVIGLFEGGIILEVGNIGLQVFVPSQLRQSLRIGEQMLLFTYLVVREDSLSLYGFQTQDEQSLFVILLGVNGIGPRLALAVLSTLAPDAIRRAVFHEQADVFSRVPGIGRKTAQKMLLYMQDRVKPGVGDLEPIAAMKDADTEVLSALTTLGYSIVEAQAAIQVIPRDAPEDVETRLRLALQSLSK